MTCARVYCGQSDAKPSIILADAGVEMTRKNGWIHDNFRIFATSNSHRLHSNKLSAAFLNRVLRVWLPATDIRDDSSPRAPASTEADLKQRFQHVSEQDVFSIVLSHFVDLPAGRELARMALLFHFDFQVACTA